MFKDEMLSAGRFHRSYFNCQRVKIYFYIINSTIQLSEGIRLACHGHFSSSLYNAEYMIPSIPSSYFLIYLPDKTLWFSKSLCVKGEVDVCIENSTEDGITRPVILSEGRMKGHVITY